MSSGKSKARRISLKHCLRDVVSEKHDPQKDEALCKES